MTKKIVISVTIADSLQFHKGLPELLVLNGWEVFLISSPGQRLNSYLNSQSIHIYPLEMSRSPRPIKDLISLFKWFNLLRKIRPDIILAGTPKASLLGLSAAYLLRIKTRIYFVHGLRLETIKGVGLYLLKFLEKLTCFFSTVVIPVSNSLRKELILNNIVSPNKVTILGSGSTNGVDIDLYRRRTVSLEEKLHRFEEIGLDHNLPVVGFVGRLTEDKGLPELAIASSNLKSIGLNFQVLLVGSIDDETGQEALNQLRSSGQKIVSVGYSSTPEIYYPLMNLLCLPSRREGLPGVVLEAMAAQLLVVASNSTGCVDLVVDGITGLSFEVGDHSGLAKAINIGLDLRIDKSTLIENAFNLVSNKFSQSEVQNNLLALFEELDS